MMGSEKREDTFRESEERYRSLVESTEDYVYLVDIDCRYLFLNKKHLSRFGLPSDKVIGRTYGEFHSPKEEEEFAEKVKEVFETGRSVQHEHRSRRDGSYFLRTLSPVKDPESGMVTAVTLVSKDITRLKHTEESIANINAVLRAIRDVNQLIAREKDRNRLLKGVGEKLIETRGYYNAWIALMDGESGNFVSAMQAGLGEEFLQVVDKLKRGELMNCARMTLAQPGVRVTENPSEACTDCPLASGYEGRSAMTIRLEHGDKVYGILSISIPVQMAVDEEERVLFKEVAGDIAFALHDMEAAAARKQAEKELRESEEKYRELVNTAVDAIISVDPQMRITLWNPGAEKLFGYTEKEMLGQSLLKIVPERYREAQEKGFAGFRRTGSGPVIGKTLPLAGLRKDGTEFPFEISFSVRKVGETNIATAIVRDFTELKKAGEALQKSEEKYRATFEHTGTCMAILEEDTTISLVNSQFEELSGYSKEEIEGKMRWTKFVHPDDVKRMFEYHKKRRQNPDGVPKEYEFRALNKSGDIFNMLIDIGMILGTKKSVISLVDVTELKQVEETINRRLEFEKTVSTISTRFVGVSDIDDAINASLKDVSKLSGASRAYVFLFREDRTTMDNTHEWCAEGVSPQIDNLKNLPVEAFPWLLSLYKAGEAIHIKDVSKMPAEAKTEKEILETQDIKSLLLFPLSVRGKFAGCVGFDNVVKTDEWNNEDIMTLRIFSGILGTAFERKRAEEALRHLVEFEGIITALSTNFINLASDEIDDGINQALRTTGEFGGVDRSYVFLFSGDGTKMDNTHEWCAEGIEPQIDNLKGLPVEDFPWWMDKLNRFENVYISRVADLPPGANIVKEILQPQGIQSLIVVPMVYGGSLIGYLGFDSVRTEKRWSKESIALLKIVGEIFVNALKRKKVEEALSERERFFSGTLNDMLTFVAVLEPNGKVIFVNNTPLEVAGIKQEDVIGTMFYDTYWWAYSEEAKQTIKGDITACASGKILTRQIECQVADGELIWLEFSVHPIYDEEGKVKYVVPEGRDVTERKQMDDELRESEEKYSSLIESTDDSVYLVDSDCKYLFVNEKHLSWLGLPVDEVIGRTYGELHSPEEEKEFAENVDEVFKTGESTMQEHRSRWDNRYILRTLSPVKEPDGRTTAVTAVSKDITGLKYLEEELRAKNAELERFTYTVSHDLRSPLVTIEGFAGMLRNDLERNEKEKAETDLKYIETAATKMDRLLNDTLQLSRIGRVANPPEDVPFGEIVKDALEQTAEEIKSSGVEVSVAEDFPAVHVDRMKIEEVLVNLIGNSINYMGEQPHPKIEIGYRVEGESEETVFFVKDNGIGIDPNQHEKVFDLFYQVERNNNIKGTGAGLAIVKRIIEVHNGRVWIESEKGKGCTVCFTLPVL